jgi:hypothetical protein
MPSAELLGRIAALEARLDARKVKQSPGQLGLNLGAGAGQPCGQSHIAPGLTCHKGAAVAASKPLRKAQVELEMADASDKLRVRRFKLTLSGGDGPALEVSAKVHAIPTNVRMRDPDTDWVWSTQMHRRVAELGNEVEVHPIVKTLPIGSGIPGKAPTIQALDLSFEVDLPSTALQSGLDRKSMGPDDGALVARNVFRQMSEMLRDLPDGTTLTCNCWNQDGYGQRRKRLYEAFGFRFPEGATNDGIALIKDGKIAKAGRTDSAVDPDEEAFVKAAMELPEFGAVSPSEQMAARAGARLDQLEQRLDIFESDISAQAMTPGGLHGGITDRRTPRQKESDERRTAALQKKYGRKSGLLQQATQGSGGGQPCGASHIAPGLTCHKGQGGPAAAASPSLSLTQATGLSNFVRSWRKSGGDETIAKKRRITAHAAERGLDDLELGAVVQYTRTGYRDINGALRGQARPHADMKDDEALAYAELVKGALQKLPEVKHAVWRGVSMDPEQLAEFKVGRVGGDPGFQSTTAESPFARKGYDGVAVAFSSGALDGESRAHQVVFEYGPGHGARSIKGLTGTDEQEALVQPGQKFRVAEVRPFGEVLRQRLGEDVDWGDELGITLVRLEPVRRPRRDSIEDRLVALQDRLQRA